MNEFRAYKGNGQTDGITSAYSNFNDMINIASTDKTMDIRKI